MTEQEYIDTTALKSIRIMKDLLREITPDFTTGISKDDFKDIMKKLSKHEGILYDEIRINTREK